MKELCYWCGFSILF